MILGIINVIFEGCFFIIKLVKAIFNVKSSRKQVQVLKHFRILKISLLK